MKAAFLFALLIAVVPPLSTPAQTPRPPTAPGPLVGLWKVTGGANYWAYVAFSPGGSFQYVAAVYIYGHVSSGMPGPAPVGVSVIDQGCPIASGGIPVAYKLVCAGHGTPQIVVGFYPSTRDPNNISLDGHLIDLQKGGFGDKSIRGHLTRVKGTPCWMHGLPTCGVRQPRGVQQPGTSH